MFRKNMSTLFRCNSLILQPFLHRHSSSTPKTHPVISFIGLGNMGSRMAANLLAKGNTLRVYDVFPEASRSLPAPVTVCGSPKEASSGADVVVTVLPDGAAVRKAILGEGGVLEAGVKGALIVDCSTVERSVATDVGKAAAVVGVRYVDAPMSGGITGAAAGTLTFMVGGQPEDVQRAKPLLEQMGSKVLHCGEEGAGLAAKMCNNLLLAASMAATAEAMNLGIKLGLDPKTLASVFNTSSGRCWSSDTYNPVPGVISGVPSSKNYDGGFVCNLMAKDLGLAENAALSCGAPVPLGALSHQLYRALIANGYGQKDFSVIYEFLKGKENS